jgi:hypothetical protein
MLFLQQGLIAQIATLTGVLLDASNNPIENANIQANQLGTTSNRNGFYKLDITADTEVKQSPLFLILKMEKFMSLTLY